MANYVCSGFTIRYDKGSEGVSNQVAWALGKSASFILCLTHFISPVFTLVSPYVELFEPKWSIGKSSVGHKIKDVVELNVYDSEQVSGTGWS